MLENFPTFTDWNSDTTSVLANLYYSGQINRFITNHVLSSLVAGQNPNFNNSLEKRKQKQYAEQKETMNPWVVTPHTWLNSYLVESIKEIQPEIIESILHAIISEGEIMKKIRRMFEIDYIEIGQSKHDFEKGIQELARKIDDRHDDFLIEGKCKKCEEWNR
jgi:hypothetical protein